MSQTRHGNRRETFISGQIRDEYEHFARLAVTHTAELPSRHRIVLFGQFCLGDRMRHSELAVRAARSGHARGLQLEQWYAVRFNQFAIDATDDKRYSIRAACGNGR